MSPSFNDCYDIVDEIRSAAYDRLRTNFHYQIGTSPEALEPHVNTPRARPERDFVLL